MPATTLTGSRCPPVSPAPRPRPSRRAALLSLLWLSGCGTSERRFEVVGIERMCEAAAACAGSFEATTCVDRLRSTDRSDCDYDPKAAGDCMAEVEEAECGTVAPYGIAQLQLPSACLEVYGCDWIDFTLEP